MALNLIQKGYDLEINTTTSEVPPQFTRGGLCSVQLTDDTFDGLDKMVLLFAPDDGRRHAPAVVELSKTDSDGMCYAGTFTRASMLHDGPVLVVLAGTTSTQTITSNALRIIVGKSLDPESGMLADPATLADVVAAAVDAWLKSDAEIAGATATAVNAYLDAHGVQAGATTAQAAQIEKNTSDIADLAAAMGGSVSAPDYVYTAAEAAADRLLSLQNENTFNFALFTDLHYAPNLHESDPSNYPVDYDTVASNIVSAINQVNETVPLACVISLGDNIENVNQNEISAAGLSTPAERGQLNRNLQLKKAGALAKKLRGLTPVFLPLKGNHDDGSLTAYYAESDHAYYLSYIMQDTDYYTRFFNHNANSHIVTLADKTNTLAAYLDLPTSKVRMIALNSIDIPYSAESDGKCPYLGAPYNQYLGGQHTFGYQQAQLDWLANTALKLPDTDWQVMIFQHHPMLNSFSKRANAASDYQRFNYDVLEGILNAFQQGTAYAHDSTTGKAPNGATSALFACTLSADFTAQGAGQIIAIWNGHIHRDLYTTTTFETLAAVTLTPNFTNKFSTADADFLSGQRFNSSGGISADSAYWVSGYIPITQGQTLRVKYGSVDAAPVWSSRPVLIPYDSSKTRCGDPIYSSTTSHGITLDTDNAGFTYTAELSETAYVRISGRGSGDGVIATVNEEITYTETETPGSGKNTLFVSTMLANPNEGAVAAAWDGTTYGHTAGTAKETSIDFVTVDPVAKKIYTTRYGAGADREMLY